MLSALILFAFPFLGSQATPVTSDSGTPQCATGPAITALLSELAHDSWAAIGPSTAMQRWSGLQPIGHDAETGQPVLFERGVSEASGEPRCVERFSFGSLPGRATLGLNDVQVIHREAERATAVELARAWVDGTVPSDPRPKPSGRIPLDGHEPGSLVFSADHEWLRPQAGADGGARETVIMDVRGRRGVWFLVLRWSRRFP
jgi:hypothetical protein